MLLFLLLGLLFLSSTIPAQPYLGQDQQGNLVVNASTLGKVLFDGMDVVAQISTIASTREELSRQISTLKSEVALLKSTLPNPLNLYAISGMDSNIAFTGTVERFNGKNWTLLASQLITPRANHCAGVLNGSMYVVGGEDNNIGAIASVERFTGTQWVQAASMSSSRRLFAMVTYGGYLLALGGLNIAGATLALTERFDGSTWQAGVLMHHARHSHAAAVLGGIVYVVGGMTQGLQDRSMDTFNGVIWSSSALMLAGRTTPSLAVYNNALYIAGGHDNKDLVTTVERFDSGASRWTPVASMPLGRMAFGLAAYGGMLYAMGGGKDDVVSVDRFDGTAWSSAPPLIIGRYDFAVVVA